MFLFWIEVPCKHGRGRTRSACWRLPAENRPAYRPILEGVGLVHTSGGGFSGFWDGTGRGIETCG